MSGGSWDYFYLGLEDVAARLIDTNPKRYSPEVTAARERLGRLLKQASIALQAIEWVDSNDFGPGDELKAINATFEEQPK